MAIRVIIEHDKRLKWSGILEGSNYIVGSTLCLQIKKKGWNLMARAIILKDVPC